MTSELARVHAVEKRFGDVVAVRGASCAFRAGEIHAVCGENGAGKSTLLKMVAGMLAPDAGRVEVDGRELSPPTAREAKDRGVAMVLQHFALIPVLTVLENLVLGAEPTRGFGRLDMAAARARASEVTRELGISLPLDERVAALGVGDRQRLEIARALFREARLVILDEPTAVLTKPEAGALYATLRQLARSGKGVVVVTHKLDEVRAHADVVTVMRRGELVFTRPLDRDGDLDAQVRDLAAEIMLGAGAAAPEDVVLYGARGEGEPLLELRGAGLGAFPGEVSFALRAGEIVGVAGVEGNGQRELVALLAGDAPPARGEIRGAPRAVVREDRQTEGLVLDASLRDNAVLGELGAFCRFGVLDRRAIEDEAARRIAQAGVRAELDRTARTLSGGNQQKVVVARALARRAPVLVAAHPTRGVDLAASREIHERLRAAAAEGAAVLVVSADLDELRALASRILVLARGAVVGELPPTASDDELGRLMLGVDA